MPRRTHIAILTILILSLSACTSAPTNTPQVIIVTKVVTSTQGEIATPKVVVITNTPTPTPTPAPTLEGLSIPVPDPRISNPELFWTEIKIKGRELYYSPVIKYINALKMAGIELTEADILEYESDSKNFHEMIDKNGNKTIEFIYDTTQDEITYAMGIYYDEKHGWLESGLKHYGSMNGISMGSTITVYPGPGFDKLYQKEFDQALLDWVMRWSKTQPSQKISNFNDLDLAVKKATKFEQTMIGNNLIWWGAYPEWLKKGDYSRDELIEIVKYRIISTISHVKGEVPVWVVVNSFHPARWGGIEDVLRDRLGKELLDIAFQTARETDPSAKLLYMDINNQSPNPNSENGSVTLNTMEIVQRLKQKNLIDGVDLQMHIEGSNPLSRQEVIQAMQNYKLPVYVTEFDVNMHGVTGTKEEVLAKQAGIYRDMLAACIESDVCESFIQFAPGDCDSWLVDIPDSIETAFDCDYQPKTAYYAMLAVLINHTLSP
jgi:endo-1,4-beta-xylanase